MSCPFPGSKKTSSPGQAALPRVWASAEVLQTASTAQSRAGDTKRKETIGHPPGIAKKARRSVKPKRPCETRELHITFFRSLMDGVGELRTAGRFVPP